MTEQSERARGRWTSVCAAVAVLLLSAGFFWQAVILESPSFAEVSSRLFPLSIAVFLLAISGWLVVSAVLDVVRGAPERPGDVRETMADMDWSCVAGFLVASVGFCILFEPLGALVSVGLYVFAVSLLAAPQRWRRNLLAAVIVTLVFYLIFVVGFSVRLPMLGGV